MIEAGSGRHSERAMQRMRHALGLAERKLQLLTEPGVTSGAALDQWVAALPLSTEEH
jgi:hypothetical protein